MLAKPTVSPKGTVRTAQNGSGSVFVLENRRPMSELSARARHVLYHCVTEYVATGEPVGSRTLAKRSGLDLSPASIRNVLADLEDLGYLRQPHTSAGRVPTAKAFRLFIDALMEARAPTEDEEAAIRETFSAFEPGQNVMHETGKLLSELTGTAAVVLAPRAETLVLKQLRFIRTGPDEVLAVLVMNSGIVHRFLSATVTEAELHRIHNLLDDVVEGRTLGDLHELFERRLQTERVQQDELRSRAFALGGAAVEEAVGGGRMNLVIEGQERLLEKPEFDDAGHVRRLVTALDAREKLVKLLDLAIHDKGGHVVVGEETEGLGGGQLAIVGAPYSSYGHAAGTVGVIGPTRMDYARVVPLVAATAHAMTEFMGRGEGSGRGGARHGERTGGRHGERTGERTGERGGPRPEDRLEPGKKKPDEE
jgi:heat-inducible transcriptional repressor